MKRIIRAIKNNAWYILAGLGFIVLFLSASASDGGAGLQYTIPPAIIGCLMFCAGIAKGNQAVARRHEAARIAARRHGMKLLKQQEDKRNESVV